MQSEFIWEMFILLKGNRKALFYGQTQLQIMHLNDQVILLQKSLSCALYWIETKVYYSCALQAAV